MGTPCVVFIGCGKSYAERMALEILIKTVQEMETKPVLIAVDELTEFTKDKIDYLIGKHSMSKQLNILPLLPEAEIKKEDPILRDRHSFKAVKERNKFFMKSKNWMV